MATGEPGKSGVITRSMLLHHAGEFDVESIHTLNLDHREISDIDALEGCSNIGRLDLSYNNISFLNALKCLKNIVFLNLSSNRITNIDALGHIEALEDLNLAGNHLSSTDRLRCLSTVTTLRKLRLQMKSQSLSNPVCAKDGYHNAVLGMLPQLLTLDGDRVRGRGSELYKMCRELDKQLETGRSTGPVPERPLPEPWLKPGRFPRVEEPKQSRSLFDLEKVLKECRDLDGSVAKKVQTYQRKQH